VRLRRLCGSAGRPLNFTVRSHLREFGVAKKSKRRRSAQQLCEPCLTESSCRRLRLALQGAHAATCDFVGSRGARPSDCDQAAVAPVAMLARRESASLVGLGARLTG
jgi:hypothetical protein